jgi:hypothetical protein
MQRGSGRAFLLHLQGIAVVAGKKKPVTAKIAKVGG